jgi:hypothetical protein
MNKKLIFEYLVSHFRNKYKLSISDKQVVKYMKLFTYVFDSNDMTAAMNTMVERGEWATGFIGYVSHIAYGDGNLRWNIIDVIPWLMQPKNFFKLMSEALEKGVIGK